MGMPLTRTMCVIGDTSRMDSTAPALSMSQPVASWTACETTEQMQSSTIVLRAASNSSGVA